MTPSVASLAHRQTRFETLVTPHLSALLGFAARRLATATDAEDAVQDACARAWAAFDDLRDDTRVRAWLFTILRMVLVYQVGREARRQRLVPISRLDSVHEALVASDSDAVFEEVVDRLDREVLAAALEAIPEDFATAVELHDLVGFKYAEIADLLGVPIGTVMSRISRGRRLLAAVVTERRRAWALGVSGDAAVSSSRGRRT